MILRHCAMYGRTTLISVVVVIVTGLMFGSTGIALAVAPPLNQTGGAVPSAGRIIVVLKEGTFIASADAVAVKVGVKVALEFDSALKGFSTTANQTQINKLAANSNVAYIAADLPIVAAAQMPSSAVSRSAITSYAQIDGVDNPPNIGVAILDTGVQSNHPDLRYAGGADCTGSGTDQPVAGSTGNHGTHVAGIVGAIDNSSFTVGSAPGARIWNYKVLKNVNEGFTSWIICGINASINNPDVSVINMSLAGFNSGASSCVAGPDPLRNAVCSANDAGILMVVAAGNNGSDAASYVPAKYPEVVTVGNIADNPPVGAPGTVDTYNSSSNYGSVVDISAPGTAILSTIPPSTTGSMTGTSMASPFVAGAAALYMANSGSGASGARSWLLSTGSVPMNTANGCNCAPPATGSPSRMLYLGGVTATHPPGTTNPSFSGGKAPVTNSFDVPNSGTSVKARDGNLGTNWSQAGTPSTATLVLDLGSVQNLTGVRWMFAYLGFADEFSVRVSSTYGGAYQDLGTFGNATAAYGWFGVATSASGRFVEFVFTNPTNDVALGSLVEAEAWRVQASIPPGTQNPSFSGLKQTITNSSDTPNTGTSGNAHDGVSWTNWASAANTPAYAKIMFDLGTDRDLSGVKWKMSYLGYADQFIVRVYSNGGAWRDLGVFGNPGSANTFYGVATTEQVTARYIELIFLNPNTDAAVGSVSEVEIWGGIVGASAGDSEFAGSSLPIVASTDSSGQSELAYDGDEATVFSASSQSTTTTATFDLGVERELTGVRWKTESDDNFTIQISTDGTTWVDSGTFATEPDPEIWQGTDEPQGETARYVKVEFEATDADGATADVNELEVWGLLPTGAPDPALAGAPLPITCTADPTNDSAALACDQNGGTNWHTDPTTPESATLTVTLQEATTITGIKWNFAQQGNAERFTVSIGLGETITSLGEFSGGAANTYEGIKFDEPVIADRVILSFTNIDADTELGYLAEVEVWSEELPAATPGASPQASPSPDAGTPAPVETATPDAGTPEPVETELPTATVEPTATTEPASPEPATETAEPTATEIPATPEPATEEPTEVVEPTVEPTAAISLGTISGTDGDAVNCRITAPDGEPITQLNEGDPIEITGAVSDGWYPVICAGDAGFIAEQFITSGTPTEVTETTPTATLDGQPTATVEATTEATEVPTEEEVAEETPYPIADTGDTENSGSAWLANDNDPNTWWSLYPSQSPEQARLYLDLGSVLPIDRLTLELATWDQLPIFEIWLSEDGETWYNATPGGINGWNLDRETPITISLGYDARYLRIVIPNVDQSGLSEVGGISQIDVWAGDINQTQYLTSLGEATTPTPPPVEPTEEVIEEPTEEVVEPTEVVEEPTEEVIPTEEVPTEEVPTEEPAG